MATPHRTHIPCPRKPSARIRCESVALVGRVLAVRLSRLAADAAATHPDWLAYFDRLATELAAHSTIISAIMASDLRSAPIANAVPTIEPAVAKSAAIRAELEGGW